MIRGLISLFELIKGFIEFLVGLLHTVVDFITMIPNLTGYLSSGISVLPSFLIALFTAAFGFIVIKAIHKYLL